MRDPSLRNPLTLLLVGLVLFVVAGCGGGASSESSTGGDQAVAVPTMPPAKFTAVAEQRTFSQTTSLTTTTPLTTTTQVSAAVAAAPAANAADLERGARSYAKNKCADCHGAQGEGVAGKGKAIAGATLSAAEFERVLRTGGGLGNSHIFGPSAISPTGMGALYAYVQSLK